MLIEHTAKRWKAMQLVGGLILAVGVVIGFVAINADSAAGLWLAVAAFVIGLPIWVVGRFCAWWFHG